MLPALVLGAAALLPASALAVDGSGGAVAGDESVPTGSSAKVQRTLDRIAVCESGGNPRAVSRGGQYRGKYQFHRSTWRSVGGKGDPARASEAEQDRRARILFRREGWKPWPVCGRKATR